MKKTLEMVFRDLFGKEHVLTLPDPKDGISAAEVQVAMETIVAKNIFSTKSGDMVQAVEARIRVVDVTAL